MAAFDLSAYLTRVGLGGEEQALRSDLPAALARVMAAQMRTIAFENLVSVQLSRYTCYLERPTCALAEPGCHATSTSHISRPLWDR
jgi:arylamine N-acetyltransferase